MTTIGSLFSGIGGLELGVERATGGTTIWQAESNLFARSVLERHWPGARRYDDVRQIDETTQRPDIICGGFPCQDISSAGNQAGIQGPKSGLWSEFARIVGVLRPRFVYIENVAALATNGLHRVLADLAALRFDAQWDTLGACCVGAPHQRERMFILASDPDRNRESAGAVDAREASRLQSMAANANGEFVREQQEQEQRGSSTAIAAHHRGWAAESGIRRVADGIPSRVDMLRCIGNAVVPQQAELAWELLTRRMR